jgi:dethiobiotin synthetase
VSKKIIFITGTDTGVGKTLFTGLFLNYLRTKGVHALAMKPFCSGGRDDVELLQSLQRGELLDEEMNPFYFKEPVAPLIAAKKEGRRIKLHDVVKRIGEVQKKCDCLLIEGVGGLLVPLGEDFTVADLISELACGVLVVSRNRLGTINHTCLTMEALNKRGIKGANIILMSELQADCASKTNHDALKKLLRPGRVLRVPFLGKKAIRLEVIKKNHIKLKKTLAIAAQLSKV